MTRTRIWGRIRRTIALLCIASAGRALLRGDEGMWLFTQPPREQLRKHYQFELTDAWLEHVQKASVRFNSGGSGSFVSEDGLLISNHHVGADALQKVSSERHNFLRDGFQATTLADEKPCVDLELNVLQSIEDVTPRVNAAVPSQLAPADAALARRKVFAEIEKQSLDQTGFRSDVITLYQGGAYHLYRFKKYTDVRLVFAPEQQIAFFGGDPDNFEYPRFNLDICLFRAYENGRPAKATHFLKWSPRGAAENELTFVSGHPGRTDRSLTVAELEFLRDVAFPFRLEILKRREVLLNSWSQRSPENARRAKDDLFGIQNSRKARDGGHAGLYDPAILAAKQQAEAAFQQRLAGRPEFAGARAAYERIASAQSELKAVYLRQRLLEGRQAFPGETAAIAWQLLRAGDEQSKPDGERLREYQSAGHDSFVRALLADRPIYEDLEILELSDGLTLLAEKLGPKDPTVIAALHGQSPRARAAELIRASKVRDLAFRQRLLNGGAAAVQAAQDPMIEALRPLDLEARAARKTAETAEEIVKQSQGEIARARFTLDGANSYPDATFTLRLSYGTVKSYMENGQTIPAITTYAGLYERAKLMGGLPPFDLPPRWVKRKSALDLKTPFNAIGTHDIIGGNSGSPVINRAGEWVGIIFDGNLPSLVLDFAYEDQRARSVFVESPSITEALTKVYGAKAIVRELFDGRRPK